MNVLEKLRKLFGRKISPDNAPTVTLRKLCEYTDTTGLFQKKT